MLAKHKRFRIGLRTLKTTAAVIFSMMIVTSYGVTTSKLIFAMLGAMAAMEHTFKESLESCLAQIFGMFFGALAGVLLLSLPLSPLLAVGIGIMFVITLYNVFHIRFSPSLPCLIVVVLCTTTDIQPLAYAIGRFWDTTIGLGIGMLINTLFFPYNNSRQIRITAEYLEKEPIIFLESMFGDDSHLPDTKNMTDLIDEMQKQLKLFSRQWLLLYLKRNRQKLEQFRSFEEKARVLAAQMEVLRGMDKQKADIITNYHISQILKLHQELIEILQQKD